MQNLKRKEIKKETRRLIKGNFISLYASNLLVQLLIGAGIYFYDVLPVVILIFILTGVLEFGLAAVYLNFSHGNGIDYKRLFISYRGRLRRFIKHFLTFVIKYAIILLSATLLIIPGLIKRYSYSQVKYLRAEEPDFSVLRCLYVSKKMMKWHRLELFLMDLTFLPLFLLSPLTGGLILLYLVPYYSACMAKYHIYLQERYELKKEINKDFIDNFVYYLNHLR